VPALNYDLRARKLVFSSVIFLLLLFLLLLLLLHLLLLLLLPFCPEVIAVLNLMSRISS
jgi:hypothetical protein